VERRTTRYRDSNDSSFDPAETLGGGHVSLEFRPSERDNVYATLARGYKAGNFNIGRAVPEDRRTFDAEFLWSFELGYKARSADERLAMQFALFEMRREDQQVSTSFQLTPGDPLSFIFFTDNAARGRNRGLESTLSWRATPRFQLGASLGLLDTEYIGYRFGDRDLDGREQAHAPQYQASLSGEFRSPRGVLAQLDVQSVDDFYFDASHDERAPAYTLVNLRLGYQAQRWAGYFWVRNVFDTDSAMRGFLFGNEPEGDPSNPQFPPHRYVQPGDPRHLGVTFTYSFR
jgi:outer membrane receptor protein involved in Fe transport